jgi:transcription termination factor Rho
VHPGSRERGDADSRPVEPLRREGESERAQGASISTPRRRDSGHNGAPPRVDASDAPSTDGQVARGNYGGHGGSAPSGRAHEPRPQDARPQEGGDGFRGGRYGRRRRKHRRGQGGDYRGNDGGGNPGGQAQHGGGAPAGGGGQGQAGLLAGGSQQRVRVAPQATEVSGMLVLEKGGWGMLRQLEHQYLPNRDDVHVPQHIVQRFKLREGSVLAGLAGRGQGPYRHSLVELISVDGRPPKDVINLVTFKKLTSIDPDFHYALGNETGDVSLKIIDLICPVGRGTRGLIVAPPRSGKTILLQKFAKGMEEHYPDVQLMVLLVDERPEEATEWRRSVKGPGLVFVSNNDEQAHNHVELAEAVWKRCTRLVELGQDVVLVLDSITRLARAYNNLQAGGGRTMSGGLDTRTMERPKQFFGSARNTETAGSLTILGTTLIETGSRMDQVIFEEFKGTGNSELVLARKLADRRIFPSIDIERSGTRKEEKLISAKRLKQIQTLRRVLLKMNFIEAMELLITKLEDVDNMDEFLKRFEVDPDA